MDVPGGISCDSYPDPLGQVISSLVRNAVTHAFQGRDCGTLQILATVVGDVVEIVVADNGQGMEATVLEHIFEPFFTTRFGQGGAGLGLSIALNIATGVLGGTLQASSVAGHGSRFTLRFPRTAPSPDIQHKNSETNASN